MVVASLNVIGYFGHCCSRCVAHDRNTCSWPLLAGFGFTINLHAYYGMATSLTPSIWFWRHSRERALLSRFYCVVCVVLNSNGTGLISF